MTISVSGRFYQRAAGQPLQAQLTNLYTTPDEWDNSNGDGFGVKATNTPPTLVADFGGHVFIRYSADMDRVEITDHSVNVPGGTELSANVLVKATKTITLDADWAAGKYVFAYSEGADGAIGKASAPYRIR